MRALLTNKWTKAAVFVVCLMTLGALVWRGFNHGLGANPVEFIQLAAGDWTLRFLVITLSVTPFRKLLNLPDLIRFRRMLGLFAFSYLSIHFLTYLLLDQSFDFAAISKDVAKRPFITVGFLGFLLLLPMAITSTAGWIRRLGGRRWQMIHRHLPGGDLRGDSLLLEGEVRRANAAFLRGARCYSAFVEVARLVFQAALHGRREALAATRSREPAQPTHFLVDLGG